MTGPTALLCAPKLGLDAGGVYVGPLSRWRSPCLVYTQGRRARYGRGNHEAVALSAGHTPKLPV